MFVVGNMANNSYPKQSDLIMQKGREKISLSKCKSILQKGNPVYTDDKILEIRDFLYKLAEIDYAIFIYNEAKELQFKNEEIEKQNIEEHKNAA